MTQIPDEVRSVVADDIGEEGLTILEHLAELGSTTDTVLAERLDTKTSTIRKALYQLYEHRIADYEENRDSSTGWLTFVWSYTPSQAKRSLEEAKQAAAEELRQEIEQTRENQMYVCPDGHTRLPFEEAMDLEFHCPRCGVSVEPEDQNQRIQALQDQLQSLEQGLA